MSSLLDAIGYVGDSLDKVGARQVRGLLGGKPRELLSFIPFSDRLGITDERDIVRGRDLTDRAGITRRGDKGWGSTIAGMGAEVALDPTNYLGGLGLAKLGKFEFGGAKAAAREAPDLATAVARGPAELGFGNARHPSSPTLHHAIDPFPGEERALNDAAIAMGPGYQGTHLSDLTQALRAAQSGWADSTDPILDAVKGGMGGDLVARLLGEIPKIHRPLGAGAEGFALLAGPNHVVRIAPHQTPLRGAGRPPLGRPNVPGVLQPARSIDIGPLRVEHLPFVREADESERFASDVLRQVRRDTQSLGLPARSNPTYSVHAALAQAERGVSDDLRAALSSSGFDPFDIEAAHNVAVTPGGRALTFDPGSVSAIDDGQWVYPPPPLEYPSPDRASLLREIGAHEAVRRSLTEALGQRAAGQGVPSEHARRYLDLADQLRALLGMPPEEAAAPSRELDPSAFSRAFDFGMGGSRKIPGHEPRFPDRDWWDTLFRIRSGEIDEDLADLVAGSSQESRDLVADALRRGDVSKIPAARAHAIADAFGKHSTLRETAGGATAAYQGFPGREHADSFIAMPIHRDEWFNPEAMKRLAADGQQSGWWSASGPDGVAWHEAGHGLHHDALGDKFFDQILRTPFGFRSGPGQPIRGRLATLGGIADRVSGYATTNPYEFVAETFAGLAHNGPGFYDPQVSRLYDRLRGPAMSDEMLRRVEDVKRFLGDLSMGGSAGTAPRQGTGLDASLLRLRGDTAFSPRIDAPDWVPEGATGMYDRGSRRAYTFAGAADPASAARHELGHALVDQVARSGGLREAMALPVAWRPAAVAKILGRGNPQGFASGLGRYLDEVGQYATQSRGLGNQIQSLGEFLTRPDWASVYAKQIGGDSPILRGIVQTPPTLWANRVPLGVAALGSAELAKLAAALGAPAYE